MVAGTLLLVGVLDEVVAAVLILLVVTRMVMLLV